MLLSLFILQIRMAKSPSKLFGKGRQNVVICRHIQVDRFSTAPVCLIILTTCSSFFFLNFFCVSHSHTYRLLICKGSCLVIKSKKFRTDWKRCLLEVGDMDERVFKVEFWEIRADVTGKVASSAHFFVGGFCSQEANPFYNKWEKSAYEHDIKRKKLFIFSPNTLVDWSRVNKNRPSNILFPVKSKIIRRNCLSPHKSDM